MGRARPCEAHLSIAASEHRIGGQPALLPCPAPHATQAVFGSAVLLTAGLIAFWRLGGVVPGIPVSPPGHLLTMLEVRCAAAAAVAALRMPPSAASPLCRPAYPLLDTTSLPIPGLPIPCLPIFPPCLSVCLPVLARP